MTEQYYTIEEVLNKLFATFSAKDKLEESLATIQETYSILYNKIFVLESKDSEELLITSLLISCWALLLRRKDQIQLG
jgi:hypothetical protein